MCCKCPGEAKSAVNNAAKRSSKRGPKTCPKAGENSLPLWSSCVASVLGRPRALWRNLSSKVKAKMLRLNTVLKYSRLFLESDTERRCLRMAGRLMVSSTAWSWICLKPPNYAWKWWAGEEHETMSILDLHFSPLQLRHLPRPSKTVKPAWRPPGPNVLLGKRYLGLTAAYAGAPICSSYRMSCSQVAQDVSLPPLLLPRTVTWVAVRLVPEPHSI